MNFRLARDQVVLLETVANLLATGVKQTISSQYRGKKFTVFLGASAYCLAQCDDRGDRTNQFLWLKLLHTSYISLLNQEEKDRVFYSVDKRFKSAADKRNFCNKQILKICTPLHVCRHFTARSRARLWRRV